MAAKKAALMVDEMYQVLEVWYPYYRLKEAGLEVNFVAAQAKKDYHSKNKQMIADRKANYTLNDN